jgi:hypothetical protein
MNLAEAHRSSWRTGLAVFLALALGLASGPFVVTSGFGLFSFVGTFRYSAFVFWFLCLVACPVLVGLAADRWRFLLVPLSSVVMSASLKYQNFLWHIRFHQDGAWAYMKKDLELDIAMALIALAFSFLVAYAFHKNRRA